MTALTKLVLDWNQIVDVTPLANLTGLTDLWIQFNQVVDITPLANLTTLTKLVLAENQIVDITPLANLMALTLLVLDRNQIVDVTPLTKLVNLERLHLKGNPISDTSPLRDLISQNPDMEIDIEISEKPPSKPDLVIESVRVNETTVALGAVFRLDAVIKNQGKAASGAATVRFYRSLDETITAEDTEVRTADLPSLAVDRTKNKWARLTAPNTAGVYYYGVCIDGVADESDTENNCSTAVKITVGTVTVEPPVVETPATTDPETGEDPSQEGSLAEQVLQKHGKTLRRPDVKEVLPDVLISLKEPDIQALLNPATINLVIKDPDLLKTMVPTISDKFIALMKTDAAIKALLSDPQVQTLLQTPAAIDELAKLLGISVAPPPTAGGVVVFRDANLAKKVREALNLPAGADIPKAQLATLMHLDASVFSTGNETQAQFEKILIKDLTGLEHATRLKTLLLVNHRVSNLSPLTDLTSLKELELSGTLTITDISPLKGLTNLVSLDLTQSRISDLSPLTHLTSLTRLSLFGTLIDDNDLTSLVPLLAGLTQLKELYLGWNQISDVTLLASFVNLRALGLSSNRVSNITPLTGLTSLTFLDLGLNQISDVSPLEGLTSLRWLRLTDNPIEDLAPLRRLKAKNPNMQIYIDLNAQAAPSAPVLPAETALFPNYPNPFNPETWIPYQLAKSADVALTIYDVRGVVVRRLALGHQTAGFYQSRARAAHWDSRNALGEKVASGLYFYTFTAGDFTATGKMLIRK